MLGKAGRMRDICGMPMRRKPSLLVSTMDGSIGRTAGLQATWKTHNLYRGLNEGRDECYGDLGKGALTNRRRPDYSLPTSYEDC